MGSGQPWISKEILLQQMNNTSQRADLLEQKQSISNLESSQITTSVAKASWLQGMFYLFFKIIRHEMRDLAFVFRFIRSLQNLIPKHKCLLETTKIRREGLKECSFVWS